MVASTISILTIRNNTYIKNTLYGGFLFSGLLNHHWGRNDYTNPLTVQSCDRNTYYCERKPTSFIEKTSSHINSGDSLDY
ncbi:hypothetical protein H8356DRAFT_1345213 [Neocallimastix lanati (nom. inval.)]|nr:hypothetical protein H8356DRAFT_1345213 [Neocallimastix sp. JGI-2020a]